jgi:hypothetical protein
MTSAVAASPGTLSELPPPWRAQAMHYTGWRGCRTIPARASRRSASLAASRATSSVDALDRHLDGRKLAGVKRRLEQLGPGELHKCVLSGRKPTDIDRLASAEGYFRALADGLQT